MIEVDVVGGRFDGAVVETATYPDWGYVGEYGAAYRIWRKPGPRRELYRLAAPIAGSSKVYLTADATHALCGACGVWSGSPGDCGLCGEPLPAT